MEIDISNIQTGTMGSLLNAVIAPRPIAWVSTLSASGIPNLAPFSYFNTVSTEPPLFMLGINQKPDGTLKDTATNLKETSEAVIHLCTVPQVEAMVKTSDPVSYDTDEFEYTGLLKLPSKTVKPARIKNTEFALECTLFKEVDLSPSTFTAFILQAQHIYIDDHHFNTDQSLNENRLNLVGRLGGSNYITTDDPFSFVRSE